MIESRFSVPIHHPFTMLAARSLAHAIPYSRIPGPTLLPLVGNLYDYRFRFDRLRYPEVLRELHAEYGPLVKQNLGNGRDVVHVFQPEDIKTVS